MPQHKSCLQRSGNARAGLRWDDRQQQGCAHTGILLPLKATVQSRSHDMDQSQTATRYSDIIMSSTWHTHNATYVKVLAQRRALNLCS